MRRRLAILLLILLPLQFSWNVAAAYCQHETGAAANHFGHHAHVHHAASGKLAKSDKGGAGFDSDCPGCMHADCPALSTAVPQVTTVSPHDAVSAEALHAPPLPPPSLPERPNWTLPA